MLDQWIEHENVTGFIYAGPLGQESGNAIDDVLSGAGNPSGRLVHTIAKNQSDYDSNTLVTQSLELDIPRATTLTINISTSRTSRLGVSSGMASPIRCSTIRKTSP